MFRTSVDNRPIQVSFYLNKGLSIVPFINAVEPLRLANRTAGRTLFEWDFISDDGAPVEAINGMIIVTHKSRAEAMVIDNLICCVGFEQKIVTAPETRSWLRRLARTGTHLGALGAGTIYLAEAGVLQGYRATVHWRYTDSLREKFPDLTITRSLYEVDRDRFTSAGGTAAMDMMIHGIAVHFGRDLALQVCDIFLASELRDYNDESRLMMPARLGIRSPEVVAVIELMQRNIELPLSIAELAQYVNISQRRLERLFDRALKQSPIRYYMRLRLNHARRLALQTDMPVIQVGLASGFSSHQHFSRRYRLEFGISPQQERRIGNPPYFNV